MSKTMDHTKLLKDLLSVKKTDDFNRIIDLIETEYGDRVKKVPVGGRENNLGNIAIGSDTGKGIVERLTNAIDAVLELEHSKHNGIPKCRSPQEAATSWLRVPAKGLYLLSAAARWDLAQLIRLTLEKSDDPSHMNVTIEDNGIGIPVDKMQSTILSLGESNKLQKPYLIGAFGQGGSSTFAHCKYSVICSRLNLERDLPRKVSFTIVFLEDLPPEQYKHGRYVYLTLDGDLFEAEVDKEEFRYATMVKHYYYDLSTYKSKLGVASVYGLLQRALFDPVIPILLDDKVHEQRRTIKGARNAFNSSADEEIDERGPNLRYNLPMHNISLNEYGLIGLEYWVLAENPKNKKSDPIKAYVDDKRPILFTLNGQTHAEFSSILISSMAELPFLRKRLVVHLDCNNLTPLAKRDLFASTREDIRKNYISKIILDEIVKSLKSDDELRLINEEARNNIVSENTGGQHEIQLEIVKLLRYHGYNTTIPSGGALTLTGPNQLTPSIPTGKKRPIPITRLIESHDPPTYLKILNQSPVEFYAGQRRYIRIETDAISSYHDSEDIRNSKFNIIVNGEAITYSGTTPLKDGRMRIILTCRDKPSLGEKGECIIELHRVGQMSIKESMQYETVEKPRTTDSNNRISVPNILPPVPVSGQDDINWSDQNWPDDINEVASSSIMSSGELIVYYSTVFPPYKQRYDQISRSNPSALGAFVKQYEFQIILHSLLLESRNKIDSIETDENEDWERLERCRTAILSSINAEKNITGAVLVHDIES